MFQEFKSFIARGNVIDLAVGIILGAAFTGIVNSLVTDIIMPPVGMILGGIDFSNFFVNLSGADYATLADAQAAGVPTINYGQFVNKIIHFLIVSFAVFILVKQVNRLHRKEAVAAAQTAPEPLIPPAPSIEARLLADILDTLKSRPEVTPVRIAAPQAARAKAASKPAKTVRKTTKATKPKKKK